MKAGNYILTTVCFILCSYILNEQENATMKTDFDASVVNVNIIPQDIGKVVLNLLTNAFYAVDERLRQAQPDKADVTLSFSKGQSQSKGYEPTVSISTKKVGDKV